MVKHLLFFTVALFFFQISEVFSQISIGTVDPGPYGNGSTITVPINFPNNQSEFKIGNVFTLYISDATGNFAGNGTPIGTYTGFYTPFINGILPNLPIGTGYKLRIVASNPAQVIDVPGTIDIRNVVASPITITPSLQSRNLGGDNLGWCPVEAINGQSMVVRSNASNPSTVTITIKDLKSGVSTSFNEIVGSGVDLTGINLGYYSVTVTSTTNIGGINIKSIRSYFLHNTPLLVNIQDSGQNIGCINGPGQTATVSFELGLVGGIYQNYPGTLYRVDWGDGTTSESTLYEIVNNASRISHQYTRTSCGEQAIPGNPPILNSFKATINAISEICNFSRPATAYAQVFINPIARISPVNSVGCINRSIRFTNASTGGTRANCSPLMDYIWYVDGVKRYETSNTDPFDWTFTTKGVHTIRLVASNGVGACLPSEFTTTICIQEPPRPAFDITTPTTGCAPFLVKVSDESFIDPGCSPPNNHTYNWIVTNANGIRFTNFDNNNNPNPEFNLTDPGVYTIALEITSGSCGPVRTVAPDPIVIINGQPTAVLSGDQKLCTLGTYRFHNTPNTPTTTTLTGTQVPLADTYTWSVTKPDGEALTSDDYTFENSTGPNTQYPYINFKKNIPYRITVVHKNTCNPLGETDSQLIEFFPAPQINVGPDQIICFIQNSVSLNAAINGTITGGIWVGGTGTFGDRNNPITTYIPTFPERMNGTVNLSFAATTDLLAPCNTVSDALVINIKPEIKITSSATLSICSGKKVNYAPASNLTNPLTTYRWTASGSVNANGFSDKPLPGGLIIEDLLTNTDAVNNATVTYLITPMNDGCDGAPFTLTVTVTPLPVITVTGPTSAICSGSASGISMISNLSGTTYTWTSNATAGITGNRDNAIPTATPAISETLTNSTRLQGSVKYTITPISANNCPGAPFEITVMVDPTVTQAIAGPNPTENICELSEYSLQGNSPDVGETGSWRLVSGPATATFTDATLYNTKITNLTPGQTYVLEWKITGSGTCPATTSNVTIIVNEPTTAGTISSPDPMIVCTGTNSGTINLTGNVGSVIRWEALPAGEVIWQSITNTLTTLNYSALTSTTQYRAVVQNGSCSVLTTNIITITVTPSDTQANAGNPQTICGGTSAILDANAANNLETGLWSVGPTSPPATFDDPTYPKTRVTGLVAGQSYTFIWTITGPSACGPTSSPVIITVLPLIDQNTVSTASTLVCSGQQANLIGSTPIGGNRSYNYQWEVSTDGGTTWSTTGGNTKDLTFPIISTTIFRRTVSSATCTNISLPFTITASPPIINNIISADQAVCVNEAPATLTGTTPQGGGGGFNYKWEYSIDGGSVWISTNVFQPDFQPGTLTRTTQYRRIVSTTTCDGDQKNISNVVTITFKPDAIAKFTFSRDKDCAPFNITAQDIIAEDHPTENLTYSWFADNNPIGNGITFPGYVISGNNQQVIIKLVVTSKTGCNPADFSWIFSTNQAVPATFTLAKNRDCGVVEVTFTNTSLLNAGAAFMWNFGNGRQSTEANPSPVTYQPDPSGKDTTYTVTLYSNTSCGIDSAKGTVLVKSLPRPIFSPSTTNGCSDLTVIFSNNSPLQTGTTYLFNFGDGTPPVPMNDRSDVTHIYRTTINTQSFIATMTATNDCGTVVSTPYTIVVRPNTVRARLVVDGDKQNGCAPFTATFDNNSTGATSFSVDFKDGSPPRPSFSAPERFQHIFTAPGTYEVILRATNGCSKDSALVTITVLPQPSPSFTADNTLGCPGMTVQFRNTTPAAQFNSFVWNFGDGSISTDLEPPAHIYTGSQEFYTVTLTATNAQGCPNTVVMSQYIHIVQPPVAAFRVNPSTLISIPDYTFNFQDESTNSPTIWEWDFGDGTGSALKNPSHTYLDTGTYRVTLKTINQQGCFTTTFKDVTIKGVPGYLFVPNSFIPGSEQPELRLFRAKGSGIQTWRFSIFNKWGQILWETTKLDEGRPTEGWDGTFNGQPMPQGVYYWKIDVQMINGTEWKGMTYDKSAPKRTGAIHLIR